MTTIEFTHSPVGTPRYLVFVDNQHGWTGPYVSDLHDLLTDDSIPALDQARVFLITTGHEIAPVHIENTDGEDFLHWEVTLPGNGGELVERIEYDGSDALDLGKAHRTIDVNGFL